MEAWRVPRGASVLETVAAPLIATSGERGDVSLDLGATSRYVLVVDHPEVAPLVVIDAEGQDSRLRPAAGARLRVKVEGPAGMVVPEGRLCVHWTEPLPILERDRAWQRCWSGKPGAVLEIPGVPSRQVRLVAEFPGFFTVDRLVVRNEMPVLVQLRPGILVSGVVKDTRGTLVEKATVRAPGGLETASGYRGMFELTVATLPVQLSVAAEGYLATSFEVARGRGSGLELRLPSAAALVATIVSARSGPLESVGARLERRDGARWTGNERRVAVGPRGELVLPVAQPGDYRVRIQAKGHREWVSPAVRLEEGARADLGIVRLCTGGVVQGVVVAANTGRPVPGVDVEAVASSSGLLAAALRGEAISRTVTASDGTFELAGLEMGSYGLRFEHPRFALTTATTDVDEDGRVDLGTIDLDAGIRLSGRVIDRRDRGLPGVRVEVLGAGRDAGLPVADTTSEEDGSFRLRRLAPGDYLLRAFRKRLLVSQEVSLGPADPEPSLELVSDGVFVTGRVHRHGEPVRGGSILMRSAFDPASHRGVIIVNTGGGLPPRREMLTETSSEVSATVTADGSFELSEVTPGPVQLTFLSSAGETTAREVTVPSVAETWLDVDVGGLSLVGRVVDREAQRGVAATISVTRVGGMPLPRVQAAEDGTFSVPDLEGGPYRVEADADGYKPSAVSAEVNDGMAPLSILLEPGTTSAFSVRLLRPTGPAAIVPVSLLDANGAMTGSLLTDFDGQTHFDNIPDGRYALVWADPLGGVGSSGWLSVGDGSRSFERTLAHGGDVRLACEAAVCGGSLVPLLQVYDMAGVEVGRYLPGLFGARFSAQGSLTVGRLAPGRYVVLVDVAGRRLQRTLAVPEGASAVDVDLGG